MIVVKKLQSKFWERISKIKTTYTHDQSFALKISGESAAEGILARELWYVLLLDVLFISFFDFSVHQRGGFIEGGVTDDEYFYLQLRFPFCSKNCSKSYIWDILALKCYNQAKHVKKILRIFVCINVAGQGCGVHCSLCLKFAPILS